MIRWLDRHFPNLLTLLTAIGLVRSGGLIHQCPATGAQLTPCCQQSPFDLPRYDRMTVTGRVTCNGF